MQRRVALAIAFTLTAVASFAMVVMGRDAGLLGGGGGDGEQAVAQEAGADDVGAALRYLAAINPPAPEPITEYVYVDEPAGPPQVTYVTRGGSAPPPAAPAVAPAAQPQEEPAEATEPRASEPAPTVRPSPTEPAAPAPTNETRGEEEFTGTVTAISGESVTFAHDGGSMTVRVRDRDLSRLHVGTHAKVHAIATEGGWVAKEIEVKDEGGEGD